MTGGFIGLTKQGNDSDRITGVGGVTPTQPIGEASSIFFNENVDGVPRNDNLFAARLLGQTTQIQWLKDIIKNQVASTDYQVKPETGEDEEPDETLVEASNAVEDFLEGGFNTDNQSFDELLKIILDDILDFNSGVLELVPDQEGNLKEIVPRDGLTFTKNVKPDGKLPSEDDEPAYFQFGITGTGRFNDIGFDSRQGIDLRRLQDHVSGLPVTPFITRETKEFSRSQIAWFSESPVSYNPYGFGRTQKVKNAAEIMINGDHHRNRFFLDNEFHKGVLAVDAQMSQDDKKRLKERFKNTAGNEYELPIVGSSENIDYISIDPEPEKMQFLESQKWYSKLVIMAYGLNEAEAGLHDNANLSVSEEMKNNIWRRTTNPLLEMIERKFNNVILPKLREYKQVDGSLRFEFEPANRFLQKMENEIINQELEDNNLTLNEARERKGRQPYGELGDVPVTAFKEYARNNPAFVVEQLTELEDVPTGDGGNQSPFGNLNIGIDSTNTEEDDGEDEKKRRNETGKSRDPLNITSYRDAFRNKDEVLNHTKDALRNEQGFNDVPGIVQHKNQLRDAVAQVFNSINLEEKLEDEFPEEDRENGVLVNADKLVEDINFRERLGSVLESRNLDALEMSAEHHEKQIEKETENRLTLPDEAKVEISFDVMDTFTADIIRQEALSAATEIEGTVKDRLKKELLKGASKGEGVDKITSRVQDVKQGLSRDQAELVARTETLQSSRKGSQALAESTDLVAGKEWNATNDSRTREWHATMDGVIVPKDEQFTVPSVGSDKQPSDYPRTARVVGEDQPFNCRCSQSPVLKEDMPDDVQRLSEFNGFSIDLGVTKRQYEVWKQHRVDSETSFEQFWGRVNEEMSPSEIVDKGIVGSRATVYSWNK